MGNIGETDVFELLGRLLSLVRTSRSRRERRRWEALLPPPWNALARTGNGIGQAPASLRSIPALDDRAFDEVHLGELLDRFWHQGTIYAATPFAVEDVLTILQDAPRARHEPLLGWIQMCLDSEQGGPARDGSHAGIWVPPETQETLHRHSIARPTVLSVVQRFAGTIKRIEQDPGTDESTRSVAREVLAMSRK